MDFSVQTVCVLAPWYLRLLLLAVVCAGLVAASAVLMALSRIHTRPPHPTLWRVLHFLLIVVVTSHAFAAAFYFARALRQLDAYELQTRGVAQAVRAAIHHEAAIHGMLDLLVGALFAASVLLWKRSHDRSTA
jgi:hypothetical protein